MLVEGVLIDVTERRLAEEELRHRADHDELTGLANRRRFADELRDRRDVERARGAVAIVDVDDLKYVNDSLGHAAGDALLRSVAAALTQTLRPGEFLARFGGDEFTVLLDVSTEAAGAPSPRGPAAGGPRSPVDALGAGELRRGALRRRDAPRPTRT